MFAIHFFCQIDTQSTIFATFDAIMLTSIVDFLQNTPITSPSMITVLITVGAIVGFINTVAGLATAITYFLFMSMGMPINIANGTTRVGVLAQFAVSSFIYKKNGNLNLKNAVKIGVPVAIGSIFGAELASVLNPKILEIVMAIMLPMLAILLFIDTKKGATRKSGDDFKVTPLIFCVFILIGAYGGFTHAGVGILILFASFFLLGMDLVEANGIKQFAVLIYTPLALSVFIIHGQVNWPVAIIYAIGNVIGSYIASKVALKYGVKFIRAIVTIVVFTMSAWLIYKQF